MIRRTGVRPGLERVLHDDEDGAEQLPARPAQGAPYLRGERVRDLDEVFERDGEEAERRRAQQRGDDERRRDAPRGGGRREDEPDVRGRDDGDEGLDRAQVVLEAVGDRGDDRRRDEADDDQDAAGDAGVGLGEAVRGEDLVQEGGDAVEEADVDGEGDEYEPEFERPDEFYGCFDEGCLWGEGGCAWRCGRRRGEEDGRDACDGGLFRFLRTSVSSLQRVLFRYHSQ